VFLHFPVRSLLSSLLFLNFLFFHLLPWPCPFLSFFYLSVCFEQRVEQVRLWASQQRKNRGMGWALELGITGREKPQLWDCRRGPGLRRRDWSIDGVRAVGKCTGRAAGIDAGKSMAELGFLFFTLVGPVVFSSSSIFSFLS
jgi:hypothetical protein